MNRSELRSPIDDPSCVTDAVLAGANPIAVAISVKGHDLREARFQSVAMLDRGVLWPLHYGSLFGGSAMDENQVKGGSGPALAAHSKDASAPGTTSASSATGNDARGSSSARETVSSVSGQAREAAGRMGASVSDAAGRAGQTLSEQGSRAADQSAALVREQPFMALALTGAACLIIGILLGRR